MSDYIYENDPMIVPLEFDDKVYEEYTLKPNLKVGYIKYEGTFYPSQPVISAMDKTIKLLKDAGHQLIEMDSEMFAQFQSPYAKILFCNDGKDAEMLNGEKPLKQYDLSWLPSIIPKWLKPILSTILGALGMKRESVVLESVGNSDMQSYVDGCLQKQILCEKHMWYWKDLGIDCMVMPAQALPAFKLGHSKELLVSQFYTAVINALDYPAGVIPNVVKVQKEHLNERYDDPTYPNDEIVRKARETLEGSEGIPIGIQVVTMKGTEEQCLGIMKQFDTIIHK